MGSRQSFGFCLGGNVLVTLHLRAPLLLPMVSRLPRGDQHLVLLVAVDQADNLKNAFLKN